MQTISMIITYDGSRYYGWQRQSRLISIQEVIEKALSKVLKQTIVIDGSGRTDAGVHALGQCATFTAELTMPIENLKSVLNRVLPTDIVVDRIQIENDTFHARYSSIGKTYIYKVYRGKERNPFLDKYSFHYPYPLNVGLIREAAEHFIGTHDFKTYMATGSKTQNTNRTIYELKVEEDDEMLVFTITGDGFLYNMVRIIVGSLLHVGNGKIRVEDIPEIIKSGDRNRAKFTASATGLYLKAVYYQQAQIENYLAKNN